MTDTEAWIDGKSVGPKHQGAFYEFRYDVTALLRFGARQQLEVLVGKESSDASVNEAERHSDFWIFGGIYRPVYLEARPPDSIERLAIDARHDGAFHMDVTLSALSAPGVVTAQIETADGKPAGAPFSAPVAAGADRVTLETRVERPAAWTAESPHLYRVAVSLDRGGTIVHTTTERFGFRTVELRPRDGLYVNGVKVRLKGVNRHSFWPDSGRATSRAVSEMDVKLIKDMNMNAVRMSHYPPDRDFLEVCDEQGLYVLDELTGWQHRYDTEVGRKLVRELVVRDVNHPSVLFWDNGNEGGFNYELVGDYPAHDPQKRPVIHPWQNEAGKINTTHYRAYDCCAGKYLERTGARHAHGGAARPLRRRPRRRARGPLEPHAPEPPRGRAAFLWVLADEGVVRTDRDGALDTDGNHGPDGIVGPYREKEASFFTIQEIWSPVFLELGRLDRLPPTFDGRLRVENRYDFTTSTQVSFEWRLERFPGPDLPTAGHTEVARGKGPRLQLPPATAAPSRCRSPGQLARRGRALSHRARREGHDIHTWTWMTKGPDEVRKRVVSSGGRATGQESAGQVLLEASGLRVAIDRANGQLASVERDGKRVSLANGPRIVEGTAKLTSTHPPRRRRRLRRRGGLRGPAPGGPLAPRRQRLARALLSLREPRPPRPPRRHLRLPGEPGHGDAVARPRSVPRLEEPDAGQRLRRLAEGLQRHAHRGGLDLPGVQGPPRRLLLGGAGDEGAADHRRHRHRGPVPPRPHPAVRRQPHVHRRRVPGRRSLLPPRDPADRHEVRRPGDHGPRRPAERVRRRAPAPAHGQLRGPPLLHFGPSPQ